ncbi:MAG: hypothetical protein ACTHQQ_17555, partial [Solirubrobacteraceae bacterium]
MSDLSTAKTITPGGALDGCQYEAAAASAELGHGERRSMMKALMATVRGGIEQLEYRDDVPDP